MRELYRKPADITGLLLAGGRSRRMGGRDKGLLLLNGKPLAAWSLERLRFQVDSIIVSANRNIDEYQSLLKAPIISDKMGEYSGPLAGIASGLSEITTPWMVTAPCDSPFVAEDYVSRLFKQVSEKEVQIAVAHDGERLQPVFMMINLNIREKLEKYLDKGGRKIDAWLSEVPWVSVDFSDKTEMFLNLNTPEDLKEIEIYLTGETT